jgi:hypothetical protein
MKRNKALQILFDTYWSKSGWKRSPTVSPDDYAYALDAGYMFEPVERSHDDLIHWLKTSSDQVLLADVSNAFLASLSTRRLELRSALGSFAVARNFPVHHYAGNDFCCATCGIFRDPIQPYDLSVLNFERYKWGGVRHERPEYIAFDLEQFRKLEHVEFTPRDLEIIRQIIETISHSEMDDRPRTLEKRLANILASNKAEREILLQILAYCGIIQPTNVPSYFESFINYSERTEPLGNRYWKYPICWWRGTHGINRQALHLYFPHLAKRRPTQRTAG